MLEKEQGMINMVDNDASIADETMIISNSLDSIADNTPLFQDLINIQVPHYQTEGLPTFLIPTRVGVNSMYAHYTPPLNTRVSSENVRYGIQYLHGWKLQIGVNHMVAINHFLINL